MTQSLPHPKSRFRSLPVVFLLAGLTVVSTAQAQEAVQWRVEDGGNGHWYAVIPTSTWSQASHYKGALPLVLGSSTEADWVFANLISNPSYWTNSGSRLVGPHIGLGNYCLSEFRWVTGDSLTYTGWAAGQPATSCGGVVYLSLSAASGPQASWGTAYTVIGWGQESPWMAIEWSLDCDQDGIIDYGQIVSGILADTDEDGIADVCDGPWEWQVADGGNGHWYDIQRPLLTATAHQSAAASKGAHLVTIQDATADAFIDAKLDAIRRGIYSDYLTGGERRNSVWSWSNGEAWSGFQDFHNSYPSVGPNLNLRIVGRTDTAWFGQYLKWDGLDVASALPALIEWSADCDGDGVVDYGQILDGTFADTNANGVPDCCEGGGICEPCTADITGNQVVDGNDLALLLASWNGTGKGEFDTDLNDDGLVDAADLSLVLAGWGACP